MHYTIKNSNLQYQRLENMYLLENSCSLSPHNTTFTSVAAKNDFYKTQINENCF